tara:strand:- start:128 stop:454 length:327 start_codon:yes stop_codon:yes gene_type:complete
VGYIHKNIKGAEGLNQVIFNKAEGVRKDQQKITYLYIANVSDTRSFTVGLVLKNKENSYALFNNINLPIGSTLKLDAEDMDYDCVTYELYIKLKNVRDNVDIKIKTTI